MTSQKHYIDEQKIIADAIVQGLKVQGISSQDKQEDREHQTFWLAKPLSDKRILNMLKMGILKMRLPGAKVKVATFYERHGIRQVHAAIEFRGFFFEAQTSVYALKELHVSVYKRSGPFKLMS